MVVINILIMISFLSLFFVPTIAYSLSMVTLLLIANSKILGLLKKRYSFLLIFIILYSLSITISSYQLFLHQSQDFTSYYNNFLDFLYNGFKFDFFEYGGGLEIGLPLLNYVFSFFIFENTPYIVYFTHSFLITVLLYYVIYLISKYEHLSIEYSILLFVFILTFYKYGMSMNLLRQTYSSLFLLIALFNKKYKIFFIIFAVAFHLSAVLIYPLIKFLLFEKSKLKLKIFIFLMIICALIIYGAIQNNINLGHINNEILKKIWVYIAIAKSLIDKDFLQLFPWRQIFYILLSLSIIFILSFFKKAKTTYTWNLYALLALTFAFGILSGMSERIIMPISAFLWGYIFFKSLILIGKIKIKTASFFILFFIVLFQYKYLLFNKYYYKNFPIASITPLYYIPYLFEVRDYVNRESLPKKKYLHNESRLKEIK